MNREILFRGKRMDNGQWVEGDLVRLKDGKKSTPHIYGYGEVDPNTVGQYTGLTDKNGRKVFEGDIIRFHKFLGEPDWIDEVKYDVRGCLYIATGTMPIRCGSRDGGAFEVQLSSIDKAAIEVIGNIHDNPELLDQ